MNKFDNDDFNASEYKRKQQRRNKRLVTTHVVGSIVAFIEMVFFRK